MVSNPGVAAGVDRYVGVAFSSSISVGVGVGEGDGVTAGRGVVGVTDAVDDDVGVSVSLGAIVPPSPPPPPPADGSVGDGVGVGVGVTPPPPSSVSRLKVPSLIDTGISVKELSCNVVTFSFKVVEVPGLPTAWKVTFAKMMSPLTPSIFHADIITMPEVLLGFQSRTVESGPSETPVT
jgi:hypothetical protein